MPQTSRRPYDTVKRIVDAAAAGVGLVALAPVMGAVACAVRYRLGSPVLFRQQRPGCHAEVFELI